MLSRYAPALLAVALCFALTTTARAQDPIETYSDTVPLAAAGGSVAIGNHEGSIRVETWDRAEVQYEARVFAERGADHPERTTVSIDHAGGRLHLQTEYEDSGDDGWFNWWDSQNTMPVRYTVKMPETARLRIDDHESEIEVTGLHGKLRVDTHEGPITISGQQGDVQIDSHESRVRLRGVEGLIEMDTHEGRITGTNLRGGFQLDTHEGDVDLAFAAFDNGLTINAHEGDFRLTLPRGTGFDLDTDFDEDADLHSSFDLSTISIVDEDDDDEVNYRGAVNGGGPRIRLASHEGAFDLRAR